MIIDLYICSLALGIQVYWYYIIKMAMPQLGIFNLEVYLSYLCCFLFEINKSHKNCIYVVKLDILINRLSFSQLPHLFSATGATHFVVNMSDYIEFSKWSVWGQLTTSGFRKQVSKHFTKMFLEFSKCPLFRAIVCRRLCKVEWWKIIKFCLFWDFLATKLCATCSKVACTSRARSHS